MMTLPEIPTTVPGRFTVTGTGGQMQPIALALADLGLLRPDQWVDGDLRGSLAKAFGEFAARILPNPLASYSLVVAENACQNGEGEDGEGLDYDTSHYCEAYKISKSSTISCLMLTFNSEELVHRVVGTTLARLERRRKGLGQTVFYWMHETFDRSSRALDTYEAYGWAQYNYWGGELDETMRMEEEVDGLRHWHDEENKKLPTKERKPFDEAAAIKRADLFKLADFDRDIPQQFGSKFKRRPALTPRQLRRLRRGRDREIIDAALKAADLLKSAPTMSDLNDISKFEHCRWEMSPYLLRWKFGANGQDSLGQIYDDYMNDLMNAGESMMDVNAVFAWHDVPSFKKAVKRFEIYLRLLNAAETLLRTIAPKKA